MVRVDHEEIARLERLKLETVAYYLNGNYVMNTSSKHSGNYVHQLDFETDMIAIEHDLWLARGGFKTK